MANLETTAQSRVDRPAVQPQDVPVFTVLLVKLASRCNLQCTYCY